MTGERTRAQCRHPISAAEVEHLHRLGRMIARLRGAAGLSQTDLARNTGWISRRQIAHIENATRRTRASTLAAVAEGFRYDLPGREDPAGLAALLVGLAGPALAPESRYAKRVARRRERRQEVAEHREERELAAQRAASVREQERLVRAYGLDGI